MYWCFVAWWILTPVPAPWDVGPPIDSDADLIAHKIQVILAPIPDPRTDGTPAYIYQDFALQALCCAFAIWFCCIGCFWIFLGFLGRPYYHGEKGPNVFID
jgi:hypothetical protein